MEHFDQAFHGALQLGSHRVDSVVCSDSSVFSLSSTGGQTPHHIKSQLPTERSCSLVGYLTFSSINPRNTNTPTCSRVTKRLLGFFWDWSGLAFKCGQARRSRFPYKRSSLGSFPNDEQSLSYPKRITSDPVSSV